MLDSILKPTEVCNRLLNFNKCDDLPGQGITLWIDLKIRCYAF